MKQQLDSGTKHLLRLVLRDHLEDGWTRVSGQVWPLIEDLPTDLVELRKEENGGLVRLTPTGETVVAWT